MFFRKQEIPVAELPKIRLTNFYITNISVDANPAWLNRDPNDENITVTLGEAYRAALTVNTNGVVFLSS
jgi:hypothetical protein